MTDRSVMNPAYDPRYPTQPPMPAPYPQTRSNNGLAIASMVLGILWLYGVGSILAIIFAAVAKGQIKASGGAQKGDGMATAGLVLGIIGIVGMVFVGLMMVAFAAAGA